MMSIENDKNIFMVNEMKTFHHKFLFILKNICKKCLLTDSVKIINTKKFLRQTQCSLIKILQLEAFFYDLKKSFKFKNNCVNLIKYLFNQY